MVTKNEATEEGDASQKVSFRVACGFRIFLYGSVLWVLDIFIQKCIVGSKYFI